MNFSSSQLSQLDLTYEHQINTKLPTILKSNTYLQTACIGYRRRTVVLFFDSVHHYRTRYLFSDGSQYGSVVFLARAKEVTII